MKRIFFAALSIATLVYATGCSTKVNLAAPYKNITVVYGILDMADTAHYIRIEKAFLSQNLSAFSIAQTADSNYYPQLNVTMEAINSSGTVDQTYTLNRVDLNLEGYQKASGTFFTGPNYAYKFTNALDVAHTYRLIVYNPTTGVTDSAVAPLIEDKDHTVFTSLFDNSVAAFQGLYFAQTNGNYNATLQISGQYTASPAPAIMQGVLRFRWVDVNISGTKTRDSADFNMGTISLSGNSNAYTFTPPYLSLYQFLAFSMGAAPSGVSRELDSCDVLVYGGTQAIATYQQISQVIGTGLTADEIEPTYTNIQGPNVLGLFAGRGLRSVRVAISTVTVDSLVKSAQSASILGGTNITGTAY